MFYINFLIAGVILGLIILPELLSGHWKEAGVFIKNPNFVFIYQFKHCFIDARNQKIKRMPGAKRNAGD